MNKYIQRIANQSYKKVQNYLKEKAWKRKFDGFLDYEKRFSEYDDIELTLEQKEEIKKFWGKYSFAYPDISFDAFKTYMNRTGLFDPKYLPGGIRGIFVAPFLQNRKYVRCLENKALLYKHLPDIKQPKLIVARMNGFFYDGAYNVIDIDAAINLMLEKINEGLEVVFKISESSGGSGVKFLNQSSMVTFDMLKKMFRETKSTVVVQEAVKQHPVMASLNPTSTNTVRLTTIIWENEVKITGVVVRVGAANKRVDNLCSGGNVVGVNNDGSLYEFAICHNGHRINRLENGLELDSGDKFQIPSYNKVIELVRKAQLELPYIRLVSWDIAIDQEGEPVLIEINFGGAVWLHQMTTGPVYGEYTEQILDECILKRYFKRHSTYSFDFKEFSDHVEIEKYVGWSSKVIIPNYFKNKPVTIIGSNAFRGNKKIKEVVLPKCLKTIKLNAFNDCEALSKINLRKELKVASNAFNNTKVRSKRKII